MEPRPSLSDPGLPLALARLLGLPSAEEAAVAETLRSALEGVRRFDGVDLTDVEPAIVFHAEEW
jgi:hypothetical protein